MEDDKNAEKKEEVTATPDPSQVDPIKQELEKVQKPGRTEAEKATFSLKKNAERAKELGIDPAEVLGFNAEEPVDKSTPLTVGMYEQIEKERSQKTALQLADSIADESERDLTKFYLANRIVPSGDPQADFRLARGMVNSVKTTQILEETARAAGAKAHASGAGAPPITKRSETEFTAEEQRFMKPPFSLSKEAILKARGQS